MKKQTMFFIASVLLLLWAAAPAFADLAQAASTTVDGAVGLPTSLVKLVGGAWSGRSVKSLFFRSARFPVFSKDRRIFDKKVKPGASLADNHG